VEPTLVVGKPTVVGLNDACGDVFAVMLKLTTGDVPPPGVGLVTVTETLPLFTMSVARMAAVSWVLLIKVVVLAAPLKLTAELLMKFVPLTVSVNAGDPATAVAG